MDTWETTTTYLTFYRGYRLTVWGDRTLWTFRAEGRDFSPLTIIGGYASAEIAKRAAAEWIKAYVETMNTARGNIYLPKRHAED